MKQLFTLSACLILLILLAGTVANQPAVQAEPASITQPNPVATQAQVEEGAIPKNGTSLHKSSIYLPWAKAQG